MSGSIIADQTFFAVQCVTRDSVVIGSQVLDKHCESDGHHFNVEGSCHASATVAATVWTPAPPAWSVAVVDAGVGEHAAEDDPRRGSATHAWNDGRFAS
ncbi:hypothetical protein PF003_g38815 [Phytophthora fragariae]|nr:hypothetical protein PF003_g38815 [Phytophthora fragariae]